MSSSIKNWLFRAGSAAAVGTITLVGFVGAQNVDLALYRVKQDSTTTLVLGAVEMLRPLSRDRCAYQVELRVTDQNQVPLFNEAWKEERGCPADSPRTLATYETVRLGLVPGSYVFTARMYPAGKTDDVKQKSVTVASLTKGARASDLILAREVGVIDSLNNARWTIRHDGVGMVATNDVKIAAENPKLAFYFEVYPRGREPVTGKAFGTVRDLEGKQLARMDLATINGTGNRSRVAGSVSVGGLAPGAYSLDVLIELADTTLIRSGKFVMAAPIIVARGGGSGYFASLSADELKQMFDPLVVWLENKQQRDLYSSLDETGRRAFLARYFGPNGPTKDLSNPLDLYLDRVRKVNERFTVRTGRVSEGWQTERGRIYLTRGEPSKQLKRPFQPGDAPPYEIWSYDIGNQYVYLFVDESRFGHYRLLFTTDPREVSMPDWQNRVGPSAVEDLRQQFNIRTQE